MMVGFVPLFLHKISKMVGFVSLRDFKDGQLGNEISMTVSFVLFCC